MIWGIYVLHIRITEASVIFRGVDFLGIGRF